jgi:hypothetical protein
MADVFGDLREWGTILEQIKHLRQTGQIERHQEGLIRLLRFRFNWQLRLAALAAVEDLRQPEPKLVAVLLRIVDEENSDLGIRKAACDTVAVTLLARMQFGWCEEIEKQIGEFQERFLSAPQFPVLREAVENWKTLLPEPEGQLLAAHGG